MGTDRARRVVSGAVPAARSPELYPHPLQALAGPSGARFAGIHLSPSTVLGTRYTLPRTHPVPYPTPYTHPGTHLHRTPCTPT